ncbi:unnamed protein product, partial [Durusdinium trenchii]
EALGRHERYSVFRERIAYYDTCVRRLQRDQEDLVREQGRNQEDFAKMEEDLQRRLNEQKDLRLQRPPLDNSEAFPLIVQDRNICDAIYRLVDTRISLLGEENCLRESLERIQKELACLDRQTCDLQADMDRPPPEVVTPPPPCQPCHHDYCCHGGSAVTVHLSGGPFYDYYGGWPHSVYTVHSPVHCHRSVRYVSPTRGSAAPTSPTAVPSSTRPPPWA